MRAVEVVLSKRRFAIGSLCMALLFAGCGSIGASEAGSSSSETELHAAQDSVRLEDRGVPDSRVDIGPISVEPISEDTLYDTSDATDLLQGSGALQMLRNGSQSPVEWG
jgi:hypothetical protein